MKQSVSRAFGIEVEAGFPIPHLLPAHGTWTGPQTSLEAVPAAVLRGEWPSRGAERLLERPLLDGGIGLIVERHETAGFHVWARRHGRHTVSPSGTRVRCALPAMQPWRWERLLFAQVLPLVATLGGRHMLHASAVVLNGSAIAFSGPSGIGKSSIAAHLVARGASLVTDDVLALEVGLSGIVAHPGACLAGVDRRELAAMSAEGRTRLGPQLGVADKVYVHAPVIDQPRPLRAMYFVLPGAGEAHTIRASSHSAPLLLGSAFIAYLRDPVTLLAHLDACARIADAVAAFEVAVPSSARAQETARVIEDHALTRLP